jgi:(E)-4-hydroxy-3-methyl-but-2-enyl pyrophosphate reductase
MKIITAKFMGFCPGVKRAWSLVEKTVNNKPNSIYILGELIHNKQAIKKLEKWGIKTINNLNEIKGKGIVMIRAHGEPPQTFQKLKKLKLKVVDTTCPSVARVQKLANQLEKEGYQVVVCGEREHPEAIATIGYTEKGIIVGTVEEARKIPSGKRIGIVSQTTFSPVVFQKICRLLKKNSADFKFLGTICNITRMAQKEAQKIAKQVDLMIVVGGKHSSNTKRLAEVCQEIVPTYHIETAQELKKSWFKKAKNVGLTAGASTPDWIIKEAKIKLKKLND